jgi:transposase
MKALQLPAQTTEQLAALDELYRTTKDVRIRQRVQLVLLASEKGMIACEIAEIVRLSEQSVRNWLKRFAAEGLEGLQDQPRAGVAPIVTASYREQMLAAVRQRPRSLGLAFSLWTCQRLADYLAEATGIRVSDETVRRHLGQLGIVLSRPQHKISSPDPEYEVKKRRLKTNVSN